MYLHAFNSHFFAMIYASLLNKLSLFALAGLCNLCSKILQMLTSLLIDLSFHLAHLTADDRQMWSSVRLRKSS